VEHCKTGDSLDKNRIQIDTTQCYSCTVYKRYQPEYCTQYSSSAKRSVWVVGWKNNTVKHRYIVGLTAGFLNGKGKSEESSLSKLMSSFLDSLRWSCLAWPGGGAGLVAPPSPAPRLDLCRVSRPVRPLSHFLTAGGF